MLGDPARHPRHIRCHDPDEARNRAKRVLGQIADKVDVAAERRNTKKVAKSAPTIAEFGARYIEAKEAAGRKAKRQATMKASTLTFYRWVLDKMIVPQIGNRLVKDVVRGDVRAWHEGLADRPTAANRALALLSAMFNAAIDDGYRAPGDNPCARVRHFKEEGRQRYLSDPEIGALGAALRTAETEGIPWDLNDDAPDERAKHRPKRSENLTTKIDPYAAAGIRLLVFTGARRGEILSLRWDYVDYEARALRLPDSKTGAKTIALNDEAIAILKSVPRINNHPFVIAGEDKSVDGKVVKTHRSDLNRPWIAVRRLAGLDDLRLHDLRHSVAAAAVASNVSLRLIGGLLGHSSEKTSARYAHMQRDPILDAAQKVGARIGNAMNARIGDGAGNVAPLVKRK